MTTQKPDGGFAFPCAAGTPQEGYLQEGMTLRDWFAGQYLQGELASQNGDLQYTPERFSEVANWAYKIADAMIAERIKQ